jgi:5,5'-dehydrodivanillate O-demethylase oxygenase subunit
VNGSTIRQQKGSEETTVATQLARTWTKADWTDFWHTGPDTLAGQYLRRFWQPVARSQDLPVGRAKPVRLMGEDLTLYRGETGQAHLVAFRCAHRGTQLSTGWVEGDTIRCFYHGWVYDGNGQCVEQPAEPEPFCQRIKITSYPTQEYLGLIFGYLAEGEPPTMRRFPHLDGEGWLDVDPNTIWPCNYFNRLENDPVHVAFVHRVGRQAEGGTVGIPTVRADEADWGMVEYTQCPGKPEAPSHRLMPNISEFTGPPVEKWGPPREMVGWRVPIDDTHHTLFHVSRVPLEGDALERYKEARFAQLARQREIPPLQLAAEALRGDYQVHDIPREVWDRTNIVTVQDMVALVGQGAIPDRSQEHLGRSDATVIVWRMLWERELRALAEGRPLKDWAAHHPPVKQRHNGND